MPMLQRVIAVQAVSTSCQDATHCACMPCAFKALQKSPSKGRRWQHASLAVSQAKTCSIEQDTLPCTQGQKESTTKSSRAHHPREL